MNDGWDVLVAIVNNPAFWTVLATFISNGFFKFISKIPSNIREYRENRYAKNKISTKGRIKIWKTLNKEEKDKLIEIYKEWVDYNKEYDKRKEREEWFIEQNLKRPTFYPDEMIENLKQKELLFLGNGYPIPYRHSFEYEIFLAPFCYTMIEENVIHKNDTES